MKARIMMLPLFLAMALMLIGCAATNQDAGMSSDEKMMSAGEGEMMAEGQGEMMAKGEGEMMAKDEMGHEHPPGCTCDKCVAMAVEKLGFKVIDKEAKPYLAVRYVMAMDSTVTPEDIGMMMGEKFGAVMEALKAKEMMPTGPSFSLYYGEVEGGHDMAIGFVIEDASVDFGEGFEAGMLPGDEVLAAWHKGPYENLGQTYMAWQKFVADNEIVVTGPIVEMYKVSMADTEDPNEYKTVIYQAVESKGKLGMMDEGDEMMEEKEMKEEGEMMEGEGE